MFIRKIFLRNISDIYFDRYITFHALLFIHITSFPFFILTCLLLLFQPLIKFVLARSEKTLLIRSSKINIFIKWSHWLKRLLAQFQVAFNSKLAMSDSQRYHWHLYLIDNVEDIVVFPAVEMRKSLYVEKPRNWK